MRAAVTHFDGDPIVLDFWLLLYEKFWRGEVDTIYADVCYDPGVVSQELVDRQISSLSRFPEIHFHVIPEVHPPEWSNPKLIAETVEQNLLLIESDGWIFGKGLVNKYFTLIENGVDIVAGSYRLLSQEDIDATACQGFMRNFFFIRFSLLKSLDLDFFPKQIPGKPDLDCFGWISLQLAQRQPDIHYIPMNLVEDNQEAGVFSENKWLHIRQMNSSILGFGNAGNGIFSGFSEGNTDKIEAIKAEVVGVPTSEWQYRKACAMRLLMLYVLRDFSPFAGKYKETMKNVIFSLGLDWDKVQGMVTFYRTVMGL